MSSSTGAFNTGNGSSNPTVAVKVEPGLRNSPTPATISAPAASGPSAASSVSSANSVPVTISSSSSSTNNTTAVAPASVGITKEINKDGLSERALKAEAKLTTSPYDVDSWSILIKEYQSKKLEEARPFYERLVNQFPLTGRYWKLYIEHEMKARNYDKVEKLFQRCLIKVLHIELWRCYLNYVKVGFSTCDVFW